jgi:hypothetical protein
MLLMSMGPLLYAILMRFLLFTAGLLTIAAVTNPSDASFCDWIIRSSSTHASSLASSTRGVTDENSLSFSWLQSIVAMAFSLSEEEEEPMSWVRYNLLFFTIVYIPSLEKHVVGIFGRWISSDASYVLASFCRQYEPWFQRATHGGIHSSVRQYQTTTTAQDSAMRTPTTFRATRAKAAQYASAGQFALAHEYFMQACSLSSSCTESIVPKDRATCFVDAGQSLAKTLTRDNAATQLRDVEALYRQGCEVHYIYIYIYI